MEVHQFYRNQNKEVSYLISAGIGALILEHPEIITDPHQASSKFGARIGQIFRDCENAPESDLSAISKKIGFELRPYQKPERGTLDQQFSQGALLLVKNHAHTTAFGKTGNQYWRFDPEVTMEFSALTVYENLEECKEALRKCQAPEFTLLKTSPIKNLQEKQKLAAKL